MQHLSVTHLLYLLQPAWGTVHGQVRAPCNQDTHQRQRPVRCVWTTALTRPARFAIDVVRMFPGAAKQRAEIKVLRSRCVIRTMTFLFTCQGTPVQLRPLILKESR